MRKVAVLLLLLAFAACLTTVGSGQDRANLPDSVQNEVLNKNTIPTGSYTEVSTWAAAGKMGAHTTGAAVADPDAGEGNAWEARLGETNPSGTLLYGPYLELPAGDYVAFYRLKLMEEAGEEAVAEIDASANYGQAILRTRQITGSDLAENRYVSVPLAFHHPGGKLECRVTWRGYAGLRIDRVALFRLEGGRIEAADDRVKPAVESGKPNNLTPIPERRPFPEIFPRSAVPASKLYVFDLRKLPPDAQMTMLTLQGLVNRKRPQLYCLFNDTDPDWLAWMRKRGWVKETEPIATTEDLIARFKGFVKGVIITDPKLPATKNVATMLAGIKDGIVISPRQVKDFTLPVLDDLRGRWKTSVAATKWAFDTLWPRLNHHVIACSFPDHRGLRDYLVENRIFIFWLSGPIDGARPYANPTAEARLMEQLFARMPANIPVMSYPWAAKDVGIGEGPGVTLFAEFAKYLVGSIDTSNLSVHSGIRIDHFRQIAAPPVPRLRNDKIYVSWIISDGDNLPVLTVSNFPQFWKDKTRGRIPLGWSMTSSAPMLIPDIVDYYYSTATTNDDFLGAVSGIGYTYPDSYGIRYRPELRQGVFDGFLAQTQQYMKKLDQKDLWIMNASKPESIRRYAEKIAGLDALYPDYGRRATGYEDAVYPTWNNVPVFHALTNWGEDLPRQQQIESVLSQIRAVTPKQRPAFMHLFVLNWFADLPMLNEIQERLGSDYVVVRPDHLSALYRQTLATEKVFVRVPPTIVGIEGQPVLFSMRMQNVTGTSQTVRPTVTAGLRSATLTPSHPTLLPQKDELVKVSGFPTGNSITLETRGTFGTRRQTVDLRTIKRSELVGAVPPGASLRFVRQFQAIELPHRVGQDDADPDAVNGHGWSALKGVTKPDFLVFGPYVPMPAGQYLAVFRVKRLDDGEGDLLTLDASANGGVLSMSNKHVAAEALTAGEYRSVPLLFKHPGGPLETRIQWTGAASVRVDTVTLWTVERSK